MAEPLSDPICAPATPLLPSAIGVVRVSGPDLAWRLQEWVSLPPPRRAALRRLAWDGYEERALVLFFPAPDSYTGEDVVELQVHGNPLLIQRLLAHLGTLGIRSAEPGEFTRRALLNGRQDLLEAEALRDLIAAETDTQIRQAQARGGAQPAWIHEVRATLAGWMARAEAVVDYGEDEAIPFDFKKLGSELRPLRERFHVEQSRARAAACLREGIRLALVGRPNAGKSTLFNALAGEDRAIVTELPGTTRDVLEVRCEWRGLPLRIYDTAGLRAASNRVEQLGVARVGPVMEAADLVLHLVPPGSALQDPALEETLRPFAGKVVVVHTMGDLPLPGDLTPEATRVSALRGDLDALEAILRDRFLGGWAIDACQGALATGRQRDLLDGLAHQVDLLLELNPDCPPEVPASLLQGAWGLLARLTGEDRAESALDQVFSGFCLGK